MIVFFFFTSLLLYLYRKDVEALKVIFTFYMLSIFCLVLKQLEIEFGRIDFFISDEGTYAKAGRWALTDLPGPARFLWYFINHILLRYDFLGDLGVKLINVPFGAWMILKLFKEFHIKKYAFSSLFILPYIIVISTYNLRDTLILFLSTFLVFEFKGLRVQSVPKIFWLSLLMFLMRPEMIVVILTGIVFIYLIERFTFTFRVRDLKQLIIILGIGLVVYFLFSDVIIAFIEKRIRLLNYYFTVNSEAFLSRRKVDSSGNLIVEFLIGIERFFFTPLPTSLIGRIYNDNNVWGVTDDIFLVVNQIGYFGLGVFLFFNIRIVFYSIGRLSILQKAMLFFLLSHVVIYGIFLLGISHVRTKYPFQLGLLIIFFLVLKEKKDRKILRHSSKGEAVNQNLTFLE